MTASKLHRVVCALFVFATGAVCLLGYAPVGTRGTYGIALQFLLAFLMFGAWTTSRAGTPSDHRWTLVSGVVARLLVIPVAVSFSHDVQRYIWDGAVFWAGLDPYRLAPNAPAVAALRAIWPTPPEHAAASTIYPPGALFLFALAASSGPTWAPWIWKLFIAAASLGTLYVGAKLLEERALSRHLPLLAFSPLLVMETATGAHLDVMCAFAVALGLFLVHRRRLGAAGAALGVGALLKFLPALALLPVAIHLGRRAGRRLVASAAVVVGVGYAAALLLGLAPLGSLPIFFERWRFGSPAFAALAATFGDDWALRLAPFLLGAALVAIASLARWRNWTTLVPLSLAAPLFVSPVVFPWYLAPLVPALALAPSAFLLMWLTAIPLTNEVFDRFDALGLWQPAAWPLWGIGIAWAIGVALDTARHRRSRTRKARRHVRTVSAFRVSVIVPVFNEEARIGRQLEALAAIEGLDEIIVVDGGSNDRTVELVEAAPGVRSLSARRGRGTQMNAGARVANGDILLFLHADVHLPQDAACWIGQALSDPEVVGGAFRTWTVSEGRRTWLSPFLHLADLRSRYTNLPYGDQALFVRANVFRQLGGFPEQPLLEDLEFSRRLRAIGPIRTVPATVRVSGRRFLARPAYYALLVNVFPLLYRLGMPPRVLASIYGDPR